ncbi:UNVERIFIED_CONTAM: hypothetical protein FKN15_052328 [Acipenser sinensis]
MERRGTDGTMSRVQKASRALKRRGVESSRHQGCRSIVVPRLWGSMTPKAPLHRLEKPQGFKAPRRVALEVPRMPKHRATEIVERRGTEVTEGAEERSSKGLEVSKR